MPLLCLKYKRPSEGLPPLQAWVRVARDVFHSGYENWREPFEVKLSKELVDAKLSYSSLQVTKGVGRTSILFFGVLWTFLRLKDKLSMEQQSDFKRLDYGQHVNP